MMDMQEMREEFEEWFKSTKTYSLLLEFITRHQTNIKSVFTKKGKTYLNDCVQIAWEAWQAEKASAVPDGYVLVRDKPVAYMVQNKFWNGEFEVKLLNEMPEPEFEGDSYDIEIPLYMIEAAQKQAND